MTVLNVEVKARTLISTNLNDKVRREKLIIKSDIKVKILTKSRQVKENGFFNSAIDVAASSMISIRQVTCQEVGILVDLNWVSHVIIWNWGQV